MNLLEITLAMLLFSTVVVLISSTWSMHARISAKSRARMVATFLAEQVLEDCINDGFYAVESRKGTSSFLVTTTMRGKQIDIEYKYSVDVRKHPDYPDRLKIVMVRVEFPSEDQSTSAYREVMYETMLSKM